MSALPTPTMVDESSYLRQLHAERRERLARMAPMHAKPSPVPGLPSAPPPAPDLLPGEVLRPVPRLTVNDIIDAVCKTYSVSRMELLSPRKRAYLLGPRMVAMFLATRLTPLSYPQLGKRFNRDHTSILNAERKVRNAIIDDPQFALQMSGLAAAISGRELRSPLAAPRLPRWQKWTPDENAMVRVCHQQGLQPKAIAEKLGRSMGAISCKLFQLGLRPRAKPRVPWTPEAVALVYSLYDQGLRSKAIAAKLDRSVYAVDHKLRGYVKLRVTA